MIVVIPPFSYVCLSMYFYGDNVGDNIRDNIRDNIGDNVGDNT